MKKKRIPGIFRKKYSPKALNKKILKRIHIPKDREMVAKLFKENTDGEMEITKEVPQNTLVRLESLSKSIKKNKGMVSKWKFFILIFIIISILAFNFIFKDKLITQAAEAGLESVFQAKVEINSLHLSLLKGVFSYQSLSIADKDNEKNNLLETGPSEFRVNIAELLSKRIRIEEMSLTNFRWNTSHEVNGVIEESTSDNPDSKGGKTIEIPNFLSVGKDDINYRLLLDNQKDNLISLNLINNGNEKIDTSAAKWEKTYAEEDKKIKLLSKDVQSLKSISVKDINTITEGQSALDKVTDLYSRVTETKADLTGLQNDFSAERKDLLVMNKLLENAVNEDINRLGSVLNFSSGNGRSLISDAAEKYIRNRWNNYYEYGLKALKVYNRIRKKGQDKLGGTQGANRDTGRVFSFPDSNNPNFLIEHILVSGGDEKSGTLSAEIRSVSSEPDKLPEPLFFTVDWKSKLSDIGLNGFIDMRSKAERQFEMKIFSPSNFLLLDKGVPSLKIKKLSSMTDIRGISVISDKQDGLLTSLDILMKDIKIDQVDNNSFISKSIQKIINEMDQVDLEAEILADSEGVKDIKVRSNIDDILVDRMGEYFKEIAGDKKEKLKKELLNYIAPSLRENEILQSSMDKLGVKSLNQINSLNSMQNVLDTKQDEIQSGMKSGVKEEAVKLIDQVPKLKLPGF